MYVANSISITPPSVLEENKTWTSIDARRPYSSQSRVDVFKRVVTGCRVGVLVHLSKWTPVAVAHLHTISDPVQVDMNVKDLTGQ